MKNTIDFIKIDNGNLGAINFNNMIPIKKECYEEINLMAKTKSEAENKYYHMLYLQLIWLNRNYIKVTKKAKNLYYFYKANKLKENVSKRCCNFTLLEEKCQEYQKSKVSN